MVGCGLEVVGGSKSKTGTAMSIAGPISSNKRKKEEGKEDKNREDKMKVIPWHQRHSCMLRPPLDDIFV